MTEEKHWVPEIMYENEGEDILSSHIPFIPVPPHETMPRLLFIFESRETGEVEPGQEGEELPVVQMDLHQYADMLHLKTNLDEETYNKVRHALALEPYRTAVQKGQEISNRILDNIKE